tara:strand:+ start:10236 stop:11201 length:966 start_codon:yes stop_codon:yes gene_type:complete
MGNKNIGCLMEKILILEGGFNEEHEISLNTAKEIKRSLTNLNISFDSLLVKPQTFSEDINHYNNDYLCFNALHGTFGEDGTIQKILENKKIRYTHSDSITSNIGFNKFLTKKKIQNTKILTAESFLLKATNLDEIKIREIFEQFNSFVVKPVSSGSSYGVQIIKDSKDLENFVRNIENNHNIYKKHNELLIERYIAGRELTVAVVNKENISEAVEVTEIISNNYFYDYQSKYSKGFSRHILPAKLPVKIYDNCLEYAKIVHDTIKCRNLSRSDFLYDNKNIYFLEINTQPGLTSISLVPEQLKHKNISFDNLIQNIINSSL